MRKIRILLLISALFSVTSVNAQTALYADAGTGSMRNYISWFNWDGFSVTNGATKTFTTADGLSVTVSFSGVSTSPVVPYVMNTWSGAVLWKLYDFTNPAVKPALFSNMTLNPVNFQMTVTATRDGVPAPFTFIAADAEASDNSEVMTLTTNGTAWRTIEFFRNSSQTNNPVGGCGTQTVTVTQTYGGATATGQNPILASDGTGSMTINTAFNRTMQGNMAVAFGIFSPIDRGDLPVGYSTAHHALSFTTVNSCNYNPPYPSISQTNWLYLGTIPGDADGVQTTNDNLSGADEDGISVFPVYNGSGSYPVTVSLRNTSPVSALATLKGWFDYNRDGAFSASESATVLVPAGATTALLVWNGLPATLPSGTVSDFGFRFRLAFNGAQVANPNGYASDGEVEDYLVVNTTLQPPQMSNALFTAPDTVCVGQSFNVTNQSTGATSYLWNFCQLPFSTTPTGANLGNPGGLSIPVFMDYYFENGNYYGLMVNNTPGGLIRLNFGNSLLNIPTSTNLGNFGGAIVNASQGIQIVKNGSEILAIIVGGDPVFGTSSRILKLSFGTSITNTPVMTNWGNPGGLLNYPHDIYIFNESGAWYGLTINFHGSNVTRFNFGADFSGTPAAINLGTNSVSSPTGFFPIVENGNHYLFVANWGANNIARINFGNSFANVPSSSVNLGNPGGVLSGPRDLFIFNECGERTGYLLNGNSNQLVRLDFTSLTSAPAATIVGNVAGFSGPHSFSRLFRSGIYLYSFVPNASSNTFSRLTFSGSCTTSNQNVATVANPLPIVYSVAGTYTISLITNENTPTQSSFCKQVVAMAPPAHSPTQNLSSCGSAIKIGSSIKPATYLWNTGAVTDSIIVASSGTYWVESSLYGCTVRDSFVVTLGKPPVDFSFYQNACSPKKVEFITYSANAATFEWSFGNGQTNTTNPHVFVDYLSYGIYDVKLKVTSTAGCSDSTVKQIRVNLEQNNSLVVTGDTSICSGGSVPIRFSTLGATNCFRYQTNFSYLNRDTTVTPSTTSTYHFNALAKGVNLLVNSDFTQGNSGFTSEYQFVTTNTNEGQYGVSANTLSWNSSVSNCKDHTTGAGNMLLVNGSTSPGKKFWKQTVSVTPHTNYVFSFWSQSLSSANSGGLDFIVDGNLISDNIALVANTCLWLNYYISWNSGSKTTADLSIVYEGTASDKFALDDLFFGTAVMQTDSVVVTVLPKPVVNIINPDTTICSASSVQLNATTSIGTITWTPSTYLNNPSISNPVATPPATIKYYAEASSGAGCSVRDSVNITVLKTPQVQSIADTAVCEGSSIVLQSTITDATAIQWQPAATLNNSSIASPVATPSAFTEYIVTATNNGMCAVRDSVKVNVKPLPMVTVTDDTTVCGTTAVQLLATGGVSYSWSPATGLSSATVANPVAQPAVTTKYKVTVTGANGCQKTDSVTIQVNPLPVFTITPQSQSVCAGSPVTITAAGGNVYNWTPAPGITNPALAFVTLTPSASGSYSVNVTHTACNVTQTLTATVQVNPLPVVTVTKSGDVTCSSPQAQLSATGGSSYQWTPATGLSNPNIPNPIASPTVNTLYTVKVTSPQGCFAEEDIMVNFLGGSGNSLYIPNAFTPNNDGLNDEFQVFFPGVRKFKMLIFNGWGEKIFQSTDITKGWTGFYKGVKQGTDVYVYLVTAEGVCGGTIFRKGTFMLIR